MKYINKNLLKIILGTGITLSTLGGTIWFMNQQSQPEKTEEMTESEHTVPTFQDKEETINFSPAVALPNITDENWFFAFQAGLQDARSVNARETGATYESVPEAYQSNQVAYQSGWESELLRYMDNHPTETPTRDTIAAHIIDQTKISGYPEVLKLECPESYTEDQRQAWLDSCNRMIHKRESEGIEINQDYVFKAAIAKACREQVMYTGQTVGTMPEEFTGFEEDWQRGWNQVLATYYTYATMDRSKQSYTWDEVYQIAVDIAYNPEVRANELNLLAPSCPTRYSNMYDAFQAGWDTALMEYQMSQNVK